MIHAEVILEDRTERFFRLYEHAAVERIVSQLVVFLKTERGDIMESLRHDAGKQRDIDESNGAFPEEFCLLDALTNRKLDPKKTLAQQNVESGCKLWLVPAARDSVCGAPGTIRTVLTTDERN